MEIQHPSDIHTFGSKEFCFIRTLLRLMSLWRPKSAKWLEVWFYPVIINLLLFGAGPVVDFAYGLSDYRSWSICYVYFIHDLSIWLGHILGNRYFRKRDLEDNVLAAGQNLSGSTITYGRNLGCLGWMTVLSFVVLVFLYYVVYITIHVLRWLDSNALSSNVPENIIGTLNCFLFGIGIIFIFYSTGVGLALAWTMATLSVCLESQLKALREEYLRWVQPVAPAISFFQLKYSQVVEKSWDKIFWWFLVHNLVVFAVPLYGYELAMAIGGASYQSKRALQIVFFFFFVLTIWLAPILIAEKIKQNEENFLQKINEFCPHMRAEVDEANSRRQDLESQPLVPSSSQGESLNHGSSNVDEQSQIPEDNYTLITRGDDFEKFLKFLENRRTGLVPLGYTWQLNISKISIFVGIITFFIKFNELSESG